MAVSKPVSEQARVDRGGIAGGFSLGRSPPPTLGDVIEAVACETRNDVELVAVVVHLFGTRRVRWASARVRPAPCSPDGSATTFD